MRGVKAGAAYDIDLAAARMNEAGHTDDSGTTVDDALEFDRPCDWQNVIAFNSMQMRGECDGVQWGHHKVQVRR